MSNTAPSPRIPERCLNCGAVVELEFCPACGQHRGDYRRSVGRLIGDVFAETLELDGRVWRTLGAMLRPGKLTREFNAGRRKRYMSPVRLYLFVSVLMFAVGSIDFRIYTTFDADSSDVKIMLFERADLEPWTPRNELERVVKQRALELVDMSDAERLREVVGGAIEYGPLTLFLLLPVYALLLKLMFVGTRWLYIDHLIFALHVHTVWFLCFTLRLLLDAVLPDPLLGLLLLAPAVYTVLALRHAYAARWWSTLLRALLLALSYSTVLSLGIVLAFALGMLLG